MVDAGPLPCRCITVDDEASFTVGDLVVHNSQKAHMTRALDGLDFVISPESGDKATRAIGLASQWNSGNVLLVRGDWNAALVAEAQTFPRGRFKDQVDAASRAYAELMRRGCVAPGLAAGLLVTAD